MILHRASFFLVLSCSLLLHIAALTRARADVSVMIPPRVEQGTSNDAVEKAIEELTRLLKVHGFDVISAGQASAAAEAEQQRGHFPQQYDPLYCLTPECANEYRKLFDATFAVQLTLFSVGPNPSRISVTLTESPRIFFAGNAAVEGRDIRAAVRAALEMARQKQEDGAGPWLSVQGTPPGATVYVDGAEYGRAPFTKRHIEAGTHRVELRAENHETEFREINVPPTIDHVELVEFALQPDAAAVASGRDASRARRRMQRSPWDWALGGTLAAVGVVHFVAGAYQKGLEGDCADRAPSGRCETIYGDRSGASRANILMGLGAASMIAGAVVIGVAPIGKLQVRAGVDRASLELRGEF